MTFEASPPPATHSPASATTSLALLSLLAAGPAFAQPEPALPDVQITAERRETALLKTPMSVGVVGLREIEQGGIRELNGLVGVVAGVAVPNGFSNMPQAVGIRGVGVSIPAMTQAVGIYVDDVPLVRGYATAIWDLPDIERIEVLRGPQGTLYGQNLTAGAVRIVSADPTADKQGWLSAGAGNHDARELRGYFNGPLGDGPLSGSLAFSRRSNEGFGHNATLDRAVNKLDVGQFRAKLGLEVSRDTQVVVALDGLRDRSDPNTSNFPLNHADAMPRVLFSSNDSGNFERHAGGLSIKVDSQLSEALKFRSITALRTYRDDPFVGEWSGLAQARYTVSQIEKQRAFSQELQWQGQYRHWSWTSGAMLVRDRFDFSRFAAAVPVAAPAFQTEAQTHLETTDIGLYGQARLALSAKAGATFGARAYRTRQSGSNGFWRNNLARQRSSEVYFAPDLSAARSGVLPKLGIDYQWQPDLLVYASWGQGAKFGGFNRAAESLTAARAVANPDKVSTWELGGKQRFAEGTLALSVALFHNSYRDYLAGLTNTIVNGVVVTDAVLTNAGRAQTYGGDLELTAKISARTELALSAELLRSRFSAFANPSGAAATNYVGNRLPYAPNLSLGGNLSHVQPLDGGTAITWHASLQYIGRQYLDVANSPAMTVQPQTYVNAGASWSNARRDWTVSLRIRNLMDKTYVLLRNRIPSMGVDAAFYNAPRTVLLTSRHDF